MPTAITSWQGRRGGEGEGEGEGGEGTTSDKIEQPSPGRWGIMSFHSLHVASLCSTFIRITKEQKHKLCFI